LDKEQLLHFPEAWTPEEPPSAVIVDVATVEKRDGAFGAYPVVVGVDVETGKELAIHCFHSVLKKEIATLRPQPGDRLGVGWLGKRETRDGREFEAYKVRIERAEGNANNGVDWSVIEESADAELGDGVQL
jgi:hypothetical protein